MSAIIMSGGPCEERSMTYMSYPYMWRPVTPTGSKMDKKRKAQGSASAGGKGSPGKPPAQTAAVSAKAYAGRGAAGTGMSSADHVLDVMGSDCGGKVMEQASAGTPPSLNARPPYFEGRKLADRVGPLGLSGAPALVAARQLPATTISGKERRPTADRLRTAHNRRQMYERALSKSIDGPLPVHYGVWEFMDPNLECIERCVRIIERVRSPTANQGKGAAQCLAAEVWERARPSSSPMLRPSPRIIDLAAVEGTLPPERDNPYPSLQPRPATSLDRRVDFWGTKEKALAGAGMRRTERGADAEDKSTFHKSKGWFRSRAQASASRAFVPGSTLTGWPTSSSDLSPMISNSFVGARPLSAGRPQSAGLGRQTQEQPASKTSCRNSTYTGPKMGGALQVTSPPMMIRVDRSSAHRPRSAAGLRDRRVPVELDEEASGAGAQPDPAPKPPAAPDTAPLACLEEHRNDGLQLPSPPAADGVASGLGCKHGGGVGEQAGTADNSMNSATGASRGAAHLGAGGKESANRQDGYVVESPEMRRQAVADTGSGKMSENTLSPSILDFPSGDPPPQMPGAG